MFNFLEKDENEYKKFNGFLLTGNKRITEKPLKTFLWLPTKTSENAHLFLYIDDKTNSTRIEKEIRNNKLNFEGIQSYLHGEVYAKICIKELSINSFKCSSIAENWFVCVIRIEFFKHLLQIHYVRDEIQSNEFLFSITESSFLKSDYIIEKGYSGEIRLENKTDIIISKLEHLDINKIQIDTSLDSNLVRINFLSPCKNFIQYFKTRLPILEYLLAITSFAEQRNIYSFKMFGEINNKKLTYYQGNKVFRDTSKSNFELIEKIDFKDFLKKSLEKNLAEIKKITLFFLRFNIINRPDNTVENKITGFMFLLEKYMRFKGENPDNKKKFLREEKIYVKDLIDIKIIKNVRNCIAHGYDDLPLDDLSLILENLEILMQRLFLKELNWNFYDSKVSIDFLKSNYTFYQKKDLIAQGKRKCLEK